MFQTLIFNYRATNDRPYKVLPLRGAVNAVDCGVAFGTSRCRSLRSPTASDSLSHTKAIKMFKDSWVIYAILSAFFAALTSILAKIGISDINSNLATAIRTIVVLIMAWGIVFMTGAQSGIQDITAKSWIFLVLSGIATGLSWLFYYKALQLGDASKVVPIDKFSVVISMILAFVILKEDLTFKTVMGGILITAGTFVMIL